MTKINHLQHLPYVIGCVAWATSPLADLSDLCNIGQVFKNAANSSLSQGMQKTYVCGYAVMMTSMVYD
jgi:hypothetical protein